MFLYIAFAVLLIYGIVLLRSERLMPRGTEWLLPAILLGLGLGLRLYLILQKVSLSAGIEDVIAYGREAGFIGCIRYTTSALPLPLQLIIALCTLLPEHSESIFRIFCIFASITGAWGCQRAVQTVSNRTAPRMAAFLLYFFLPSLVLSDAAGTGSQFALVFLILAVDCFLSSKGTLGAVFAGLAVAFRPGSALLLPVFLVFKACSARKGKFILFALGTWFVSGIPFLLMGRAPGKVYPLWPGIPYLFSLAPAQGCPGLFSTGLFSCPAVVGILLFAGITALLVWFLGRRELLKDKRGQLGILALAALVGCLLLPWTDTGSLLAAEAVLVILCCGAPGAIPSAVCIFLTSGVTLCGRYLPGLAIPYASFIIPGGMTVGLLLLLLYSFGRPTKGSR